jgi:DNA-directed RNA polymerase subunit RPC12/RpoP
MNHLLYDFGGMYVLSDDERFYNDDDEYIYYQCADCEILVPDHDVIHINDDEHLCNYCKNQRIKKQK